MGLVQPLQRGLDFVICFYFARHSRVQVQEQEDDDGQGREEEEVMELELELEQPRLPWSPGCDPAEQDTKVTKLSSVPNLSEPRGGQSSEPAPGADTPSMEQ